MLTEKERIENFDTFYDFFPEFLKGFKKWEPDTPNSELLWEKMPMRDLTLQYGREYPDKWYPEFDPFMKELDSLNLKNENTSVFWEKYRPFFHEVVRNGRSFLDDPEYHPGDSVGYDKPIPPVLPAEWGRLHFRNGLCPESFLDDPAYFADNILRILDEAEAEYGYTVITSLTWLNSYEPFLKMFPASWGRNITDRKDGMIFGNLGFLGQMINKRGALNRKNAEYLVQYGKLKYPVFRCHCGIAELRDHLQQFI